MPGACPEGCGALGSIPSPLHAKSSGILVTVALQRLKQRLAERALRRRVLNEKGRASPLDGLSRFPLMSSLKWKQVLLREAAGASQKTE